MQTFLAVHQKWLQTHCRYLILQ